jgi:anti-sigma B factor antagonist
MEESERFSMEARELGRGIVLDLGGDLSSPYSDQLLERIEGLLALEKIDLILNFRELEYISDEAIGQLKWALEKIRDKGGDIKIINMGPVIKHRFDALGVSDTFNIHLPVRLWDRERLVGALRRMGIYFSRRTGLRVSTLVLIVLLAALVGWYISLKNLIGLQSEQLGELNAEITNLQRQIFVLESERSRYIRQANDLKARLEPLEAIGFFTLTYEDLELDSGAVMVIATDKWSLEQDLLPGGDVVDSLVQGDSVIVISHLGTRVKVQTMNGQEGWLSQDAFLEQNPTVP